MTATSKYFEDFELGETYESRATTLTEEHFLSFAEITGDAHPIHYDDTYAKKSRFGKRVTHGLLVAAMGAMGASTLSPLVEESMVAFIDQSSRFLKPVLIGDTIKPEFVVSELVPKCDFGVLRLETRITNQHGEIVLEGRHAYLLKKRPTAHAKARGDRTEG